MLGAMTLAALLATQAPADGTPEPPAIPPPTLSDGVGTTTDAAAPMYAFEIRVIQTEGIGWRREIYGRARRLDWQYGATVWAVPDDVPRGVLAEIEDTGLGSVVQLPKLRAAAGEAVRTLDGAPVDLVVGLERVADGPVGDATALAFRPVIEKVHNGIDLTLSATPGAEGLVVGVNLDETRIRAVHTGSIEDGVRGEQASNGSKLLKLLRLRDETDEPKADETEVRSTYQVPEIARGHVEGAWPLRPGEHLLISLGARGADQRWGKEIVSERLILITPGPDDGTATAPASSPVPPPPNPSIGPMPVTPGSSTPPIGR